MVQPPVAGVAGEFDGDDHSAAGRRSKDADRDTAFRDHGLEVFRVTGYDDHQPHAVVARLRSAYARAASSSTRKTWTLKPPPHWEVPPILDEQQDLEDVMREIHRLSD